MEKELRKLYYEPKTGFGSPAHLYKNARKAGLMVKMKEVTKFVKKQEIAQIYKPNTTKREIRHFKIASRRGYWQIDHTFMKHKKINNNYHAIFVAINIGSRYVYAKAMKNIQEDTVIETFNDFAKKIKRRHIKGIVSDKGVEFTSHAVKDWMEENKVHHRILHPTYHYLSNSIVERYNGVLKTKLHKYMMANKTKKWIDSLDDIVYNHNHSIHSASKERPKDLLKDPIKELIFRLKTENYNNKLRNDKRFVLSKLKVGSKVRILRRTDKPFDKKIQKYNTSVHKIKKFIHRGGLIKLKDKSRLVRPFEVLPVDKGVEKNPFMRKITSPDVEKALEKGRKIRSERSNEDEEDSNDSPTMDDDVVPEPREKRQQIPRKPIETVPDVIKKKKPSVPYVQQYTPVAFVNNSKYRIKWIEKNHKDYNKVFSVTIKDVDIQKKICSIQYYRNGNWELNQSLANFDVIDKRNNKIPMINQENMPEKNTPVSKSKDNELVERKRQERKDKKKAQSEMIRKLIEKDKAQKENPVPTKSAETIALEQRRQKRKDALKNQKDLDDKAFNERNERVKIIKTNWGNRKEQPVHVDFLQSLGR